MSDYEQLRKRHLTDAMALAPRLMERVDWPADGLAAHRTERLREVLRAAVERSPWHRKRLEGLNIDRFDETSLAELPVMTKSDLMDHFDEIVTDDRLRLERVNAHLEGLPETGYLLDRYTAIASSGSTGRRAVFVYDWNEWAVLYVGLFRYLLRSVATDPELRSGRVVMAAVAASHPTHASAAYSRTFSGPHLPYVRYPITLSLEEIVAGLNQTQPTFLHGYASALHLLTHEARAGRLRIAPKRVLSSAEPLLPEIRSAVEETWGVRVGNWWGASEGGPLGVPCAVERTHLSEDLLIVEPVDEQGRPVPPGVASAQIYLTNLYNHTMPLIRYKITDEVTLLEEPCPCGSAHRCTGDIQGRLDDTFVYQGRSVHPHVFRSPLGRRGNIVEYQVRQTTRGAAIAVCCRGGVDLQGLEEEIAAALARLGLAEPEITVAQVDRLDRQATGKLKRFVPLRRSPPDAGAQLRHPITGISASPTGEGLCGDGLINTRPSM